MSKATVVTAVISLAVLGAVFYKGRQLKHKVIEAMKEMEAKDEPTPVVAAEKETQVDNDKVDTLNASSAI